MPQYSVFVFILLGVLWDSWVWDLVLDVHLGKFSVIIASLSLLLWHSIHVYYIFISCPIVPGYSFLLFFSNFCSLWFLIFKDSNDLFSTLEILSSGVSSLLMDLSKAFFLLGYSVFFLSNSPPSTFGIFISLLTL